MSEKRTMVYLPIERLTHHPKNPRADYTELEELAESIKAKGIMQNLTVVEAENENYYVVIGNRRLEAAKKAGLSELPCVIAEMTEQEVISTMLIENIQRSDLTIYEQAQGFQLMLDIGETVGTIAEKTGFSETTIRRRVKLMELDPDKLKKAVKNQISLTDIAKINEIKSVERRNRLLDVIGTVNFNYEYNRMLNNQKEEEENEKWKDICEKAGIKVIESGERYGCGYAYMGLAHNEEEIGKYVAKGAIGGYPNGKAGVFMYEKKKEPQLQEERETAERCKRYDTIREKFRGLYNLRQDFVSNMTNVAAKKGYKKIVATVMQHVNSGAYSHVYDRDMWRLLDIKGGDEEKRNKLLKKAETSPEKVLFTYVYLLLSDMSEINCVAYTAKYIGMTDRFKDIYDFLEAFGYEKADEERELLDGTSKLYMNDDDENDESGDEGDEDDYTDEYEDDEE